MTMAAVSFACLFLSSICKSASVSRFPGEKDNGEGTGGGTDMVRRDDEQIPPCTVVVVLGLWDVLAISIAAMVRVFLFVLAAGE